jgi:hypothetical protein
VPGPPAPPGTTPQLPGSTTAPGAPGSAAPTSPAPGPDEDVLPQPDPVTDDGITITSVTPDHGPATGGTPIMIAGSGFPAHPVVTVGGRPAPVLSRGLASLTVATPGGDPGATVDVTVADRTDRSVTMADAFHYDGAPVEEDDPAAPTTPPATSPATGGPGDDATPEGPEGSTYRPVPALGSVTTRNGLRLAPILSGSPLGNIGPAQWPVYRCAEPACRAVAVR